LKIVHDDDGRLVSIELARVEMRELLAFEATCACLIPRSRRAFLEATMRNYRIPEEQMAPLLQSRIISRAEVWELQIMKRAASGDAPALEAIAALRKLEAELGRDVLQIYVDRNRITNGT
jgi:hypothetical protein